MCIRDSADVARPFRRVGIVGLNQERAPIIGRPLLVEHGSEDGIGAGPRAIDAQGVRIIDPGEDDDPGDVYKRQSMT